MVNKKSIKSVVYTENIDELITKIENLIFHEDNEGIFNLIENLHYGDIAYLLDHSSLKSQEIIVDTIKNIIDPHTIVSIGSSARKTLVKSLGYEKIADLIDKLELEDAIEVLDNCEHEEREILIEHLSRQKALEVKEGLNYSEDRVGRIMSRSLLVFSDTASVDHAIRYIRQNHQQLDLHAAIIIDKQRKPVGTFHVSKLFQHAGTELLKDVATLNPKIVNVNDEINDLVYFFKQYALDIVPVINEKGKLVGSVSIDNMLYIIEEKTEFDLFNLSGVGDQDTFDTVIDTAKHRFLWLFMNLLIAFMTAIVISKFSQTIIRIVAVASVMPIVASMGGNAGTQVMTVTVRALSKKDINRSNIFRVVLKEIAVCEFNAFWLSIIGATLIMCIYRDVNLSMIFAASVMINFFIAGLFGAVIPIVLDKLEVDPATASSVFLTALTDGFGFFTFLGLSYLIL